MNKLPARQQITKLPFEYKPNDATAKQLLSNNQDKDYQRFDSLDGLFADLKD